MRKWILFLEQPNFTKKAEEKPVKAHHLQVKNKLIIAKRRRQEAAENAHPRHRIEKGIKREMILDGNKARRRLRRVRQRKGRHNHVLNHLRFGQIETPQMRQQKIFQNLIMMNLHI